MPIKWRLVLLSTTLLILVLCFFHVFVYQLFERWSIHTEQDVLSQKLNTLSEIYVNRDVDPHLKTWLQPFVDEGQAIRIIVEDEVELEINHGIPENLFLTETDSGEPVNQVKQEGEHRISVLTRSLSGPGERRVELYTDFTSLNRYLDTMLQALMIGSSVLLLVVAAGGYWMSRIALRPVQQISKTVRKMDPSRMENRLDVKKTGDEIEVMSHTFNHLLDRIYAMIKKQKQFVADASHELRTPVSVIRGYVNLLKRWGKDDPSVLEESLAAIEQETARLERSAADLLKLARLENEPEGNLSPLDLVEEVSCRVDRWRQVTNRSFRWDPPTTSIKARISSDHWGELVDILLDNGVRYSEEGTEVRMALRQQKDEAWFEVENDGKGIDEDDLPHVFERFYRGKTEEGQPTGTGLGLAIAKEITEKYGGSIHANSEPGQWTRIRVKLPLSH
ncbi:MAG: ATP-binding protein [Firmicutes bacterium]|uniref:histidine kinase n=1 Tax=Melghirimyces thermohalophilus TaxID=1236220 RepID=A0A1G6RR93_9BACL|nr:ATP-binding protein [Melghirimyces thermohalophilus]MDA8353402.1 ATP-binding protein [Bacillota bacterium]SDD06874.1 Signal transduction histidine kinase [Melghirimyces thermohalophilus]